jgi:hypothetical protein
MNLSVIHFLLAPLSFFQGRELKEAKPFLTLRNWVLFANHLGVENLVATTFEELQEVKIVKVLGKISDVH